MAIEAKVARIISQYDLAFNAGIEHGVEQGDIATLYRTIEINDPETKESLGHVRRSTLRLRIIAVEDKFSVGRSIDTVAPAEGTLALTTVLSGTPSLIGVTDRPSAASSRQIYVAVGAQVEIEKTKKPTS